MRSGESAGALVLNVVADNSPLGLAAQNVSSIADLMVADNASSLLGQSDLSTVNFFLAIDGGAPVYVTVNVSADDDNPVTIDSLLIDVNAALVAAGITSVTATKTADDRLRLQINDPALTFQMTRQLSLWSGFTRSDLDSLPSSELVQVN